MRKVYMMIGPPASGKSTFVNYITQNSHSYAVVSRDAIRAEVMGDNEWSKQIETETFAKFKAAIIDAVESGVDTIYIDATHTIVKRRADVINFLKSLSSYKKLNYQLEAVVMEFDTISCIERNLKREGRAQVPLNRMRTFIEGLQRPLHSEGFDSIVYIKGVKKDVGINYYWDYVDSETSVD